MSYLIIELSIESMSEGLLYFYDEERGSEIEIDVKLEFEYDAEEKEQIDCPRIDERLELTKIIAPFGEIDIDSIQNLEKFNNAALECMHREGLAPSECPELFNGTLIDLDNLKIS